MEGISIYVSACILLVDFKITTSLDNGLARTPPMGFLAWPIFGYEADCGTNPDKCVSESLFESMADAMVNEGYRDAGYEYVISGDCWLEKERDENGFLQADNQRFPNGVKALADYIHDRKLKFGLSYGTKTCQGYPGLDGHLEKDANTFAEWGVDYLKIGGCYSNPKDFDKGYPEFGEYLNKTDRPIFYACSWPAFQESMRMKVDYAKVSKTCNSWRNNGDMDDSWSTVSQIIDHFGKMQEIWAQYAGPGGWNDPDALMIGNHGLSYKQSKTQMAIWAILAAPLLMSVDLRSVKPEYKRILQNRKIIAVNQDALGIQGKRLYRDKGVEVWVRPINPVINGRHSYAVALLNTKGRGSARQHHVTLKDIGLNNPNGYEFENLYADEEKVTNFILLPSSQLKVHVKPTGVKFFKATVIETKGEDVKLKPTKTKPRWVEASGGDLPMTGTPVYAGPDGDGTPVYVARVSHEGGLLPAKLVPSHGHAYVPFARQEYSKSQYEVLVDCNVEWVPACDGDVPDNAFPAGETEDGEEELYVGRATYNGATAVGKVHSSHEVLYIPYGGKEVSLRSYQVLCTDDEY